jgi:hypothetical protein
MSIILGHSQSIDFISGSVISGSVSESQIVAKWEIDPDDGKSFQLRVPSESFSGDADRIAFYVSSSGEIGVNTKTPATKFQISGSGTSKQGETHITENLVIAGDITSSGIISSSGYLYVAGLDGGTF